MVGSEINQTNDPLAGRLGSLDFDDEGFFGRGIAYRRADMDQFEGVDFMRMAEWTAQHNGVWRSEHIVSQKFRQWAKRIGVRYAMNGVKLID